VSYQTPRDGIREIGRKVDLFVDEVMGWWAGRTQQEMTLDLLQDFLEEKVQQIETRKNELRTKQVS